MFPHISLRNPKKFRTCELFKFSNPRFFYPYKQWNIFERDFFRQIALQNLQRKNLAFSETDIVESACYIHINVSEIHSGNYGKSTAHAQDIIVTLIGLGFMTCLGWGGHPSPSNFVVSEPVTTKVCTAIDHRTVSLNMKKICIKLVTSLTMTSLY